MNPCRSSVAVEQAINVHKISVKYHTLRQTRAIRMTSRLFRIFPSAQVGSVTPPCTTHCSNADRNGGGGRKSGRGSQGKGIFEAVIFISILINCRSGLILSRTLKACCFVVFCRYLRFCFGYFSVYHIERYICVARM